MEALSDETELFIKIDTKQPSQDFVSTADVDTKIAFYQSLKPESPDVLNTIGRLYGMKKGDHELAISYFQRALQIQEKNNEDTCDTLTEIAIAYQNLQNYKLALTNHFQALAKRQMTKSIDPKLVAICLVGIANAYWSQGNLSKALKYAEQALTLNLSVQSNNELTIAANLTILANIYQSLGDHDRALQIAIEALMNFEQCVRSNSSVLAPILNNIAGIQIHLNLYNDALVTFVRLLDIYRRILPKEHSQLSEIENNIRELKEVIDYDGGVYSFSNLRQFLAKIFIL